MSRGQRPSLLPAGLLRRSFSALPSHTIVPMPALSPTMETGSIAKWILKEGEWANDRKRNCYLSS